MLVYNDPRTISMEQWYVQELPNAPPERKNAGVV
jgi:hypothetical protein